MTRRYAAPRHRRGYRRAHGGRGWRRFVDPRWYLKIAFYTVAGVTLVAPYGADALNNIWGPRGEHGCRITRVIDGDTVNLACPNGLGAERTRLVGFDTPEKFGADCPSEAGRALAAEWHLRRLVAGGEELKVIGQGRDRYERRLVRLWIDGEDVARLMIDAGHARAYRGGARGGWC